MAGEVKQGGAAAGLECATLGGGCFWCLEAAFSSLRGVVSVTPGYAGGFVAAPSYAEVCRGTTGHAEVVQICFDPALIGYETLLDVFFEIHDPTTPNRQGHDVGSQYRSLIVAHNEPQKAIAYDLIRRGEAANRWGAPPVTEVLGDSPFYPAEADHVQYYLRNPEQGYCQVVIAPKLAKLRRHFGALLDPGANKA